MSRYSLQEIEDNIRQFEGVTVLPVGQWLPMYFVRKYSEHFSRPLGGNATVDDLKRRVLQFARECGRPECDISPDQLSGQYGVYYYDNINQPAKLFAQFDETNYELFDASKLPEETLRWILVNKQAEVLGVYERSLSA